MEPEHDKEMHEQIAARLKQLPQVVRDAITSADVEQHLRSLADSHQLHLDQWEVLENEVMLTLLGFQKTEDLEKNILEGIDVTPEIARELAHSISETIFAPIREELEHELQHPDAEKATPASVLPATPPAPAPTEKAVRAETTPSYLSKTPSHERKTVEGDPYREQLE